ncbi:Di-copper centre-containing protein [Massarina eburnea CBS 473.64]|uniref:Di-copper centre-containing protein n=1 Tax=Massarina eburnea CBS 473.64 TaxID=1395130 RepID=A0A6A6S676_9PLEO|nr:Di-copper centre-containing protein [Massarina eburnea CBS 473.64]
MHLNTSIALCLLAGAVSQASPTPQKRASITLPTSASTDITEAVEQLAHIASYAQDTWNTTLAGTNSKRKRGTCNIGNVSVRKEWNALSNVEKKAYTDAVVCLQSKEAQTPTSLIPGVRSRFDDWVGAHINQTREIHYTGIFLAWHRYFTWEYERALQNECNYTGTQPYWDWTQTAITGLENSSMLDGSEYSMSGNGAYVANRSSTVVLGDSNGVDEIIAPAGTGGGCVTSGPFANMTVNLGPVSLIVPGNSTESNGDGLEYNPRCLKRDLTTEINRRYANATSVVDTLIKDNVDQFQMTMQGMPDSGELGIHGGGHFAMGGDPARDLYISPGEPLFFLHHAMIDRVWWMYQSFNIEANTAAEGISGTATWLNEPASANTTLETMLNLGYAAGESIAMSELMSTIDGPFCYAYE